MLISHSRRFIFIHVYKTAGTSVMDLFLPYSRTIDKLVYHYTPTAHLASLLTVAFGWTNRGNAPLTGFHKHASACEVRARLGPDRFDSYFSFAFVRNPFDWLVSLYFYLRQHKLEAFHKQAATMPICDFIQWYVDREPKHQLDFLMDTTREQFLLDHIGRFETLQDDLHHILQTLNLPPLLTLRNQNESRMRKEGRYEPYYDEMTRSMVADYFQHDLQAFGYSFDGPHSTAPIIPSPA